MSEQLTDAELAEMLARCEAATPGPWKVELQPCGSLVCDADDMVIASFEMDDDNIFAAHARTDMPRLLAEVARLRAALAEADELAQIAYHVGRQDGREAECKATTHITVTTEGTTITGMTANGGDAAIHVSGVEIEP